MPKGVTTINSELGDLITCRLEEILRDDGDRLRVRLSVTASGYTQNLDIFVPKAHVGQGYFLFLEKVNTAPMPLPHGG